MPRSLWLFSCSKCPMLVSLRTYADVVCVLLLVAPAAAAQTTAEDGIRAMVRGDYQAAARVLRPLADDEARPDPVAQFFLAILYETGQGVPADMGRACRLFQRSGMREHPFSEQSAAIGAILRDQLGGAASPLCVTDEGWRGGPPQSFALGPDHRIVFADTSIRVGYGEREEHITLSLPSEGIFLPIQYTPLDVRRPKETRRHFFQWFYWRPEPAVNPSSWTLSSTLSEVVGGRWIVITFEKNLLAADGPTPPTSREVAKLVRLRVNANGEAEFSIPAGASPRTEIIRWQGSR